MIKLKEKFILSRTIEDINEIGENLITVDQNINGSIQALSETSIYFDYNVKRYKLYVENYNKNYFQTNDIIEDKNGKKYKVENEEFIQGFLSKTSEIILTKIE